MGGPRGDQPVAPTGKEIWGLFEKGSPAQPMEARAPHDFEHDALVPGPGNAEHFSLAFITWLKVKGGKEGRRLLTLKTGKCIMRKKMKVANMDLP